MPGTSTHLIRQVMMALEEVNKCIGEELLVADAETGEEWDDEVPSNVMREVMIQKSTMVGCYRDGHASS